jgi:plastocyanin
MIRRSSAMLAVAAAGIALLAAACDGSASASAAVRIHFSLFETEALTVRAGEPLTVTIRNDDPIAHEWMVGDAALHERHRTGTEPFHNDIPTEVTIPAFSSRTTTITFDEPGEYLYICHLPGHEAYGMVGILKVTEG